MNSVVEKGRVRIGPFATSETDGFNGFFELPINGEICRCIASDGVGWEHVSVSKQNSKRPPNWEQMCIIKDLFWGDDVWVVQFHPARGDYVNNHPGCLHLWRPTDETMPHPPHELVGIKNKTPEDMDKLSDCQKLGIFAAANYRP